MSSELVKVEFYFPRLSEKDSSRRELADLVLESMQKDGSIEYAGYLQDEDLHKDLVLMFKNFKSIRYKPLSAKQKTRVAQVLRTTIRTCYRTLPHPELPIYIFVFPWFPAEMDSTELEGINAVAVHQNVMHIFLDTTFYTEPSLKETLAHEYCHLVFYHYQQDRKYSLLDHIAIEGLAENFREETIGGAPAPWSIALTEEESVRTLKQLQPLLASKSSKVHKEILFGSKKYRKWTGYSVGYWFVKKFKKRNISLSWPEIIQIPPTTFF